MNRAVVPGHDVPGRLRSPGGAWQLLVEQVRWRRVMDRPDELLLLLGQVSREVLRAVRTHPDTSVRNFDVREDFRLGELVLLALRRFVVVGGEGGDVDQAGDAVVGSRRGDDGSAVGVADEDRRARDAPQRAPYGSDIAFECLQAVLGGHHLVPLRLQRGDDLAEGRAISPNPVREDNAWFRIPRHGAPLDKGVLLDLRYPPCWHGMPARTHTSRAATNASCASGGTDRSLPGAHAQRTSGSTFMCSMTSSPVRWPPFRAGSFNLLADLRLGPAFPFHGQRGEVPGRYTWHKAVGAVGRLMARLTRLGGRAVAVFSADDQRSMDRGGVRLPGRLVLMAVHAPWMHDDARDRVERRRLARLCRCAATRGEREDDDERSNPAHCVFLTPSGGGARAAACVSAYPSPRRPRSPVLVP